MEESGTSYILHIVSLRYLKDVQGDIKSKVRYMRLALRITKDINLGVFKLQNSTESLGVGVSIGNKV